MGMGPGKGGLGGQSIRWERRGGGGKGVETGAVVYIVSDVTCFVSGDYKYLLQNFIHLSYQML